MSSKEVLDADILATMTPEERAAFEDDGDTTGSTNALQAIIDKPGASEDYVDPADELPDDVMVDADGKVIESETVVPPAAKVETPQPAADVVDVVEKTAPAAKPAPEAIKLPDGYDAQVTDLAAKSSALRQEFNDGEIDLATFDARNADLVGESVKLQVIKARVEDSEAAVQQDAKTQWDSAVSNLFTSVAKAGGTDYATDSGRRDDLDGFLKSLSRNPANEDKSMDWFLTEAHKRVNALHGVATPAPVVSAADKLKAANATRIPPVGSAPKTLSQVPGGEAAGDIGDEFASIDSLDGEDLELAIGRMSPAQRAKFERGGK